MQIHSCKNGNTLCVELCGELDHHFALKARQHLDTLLEPDIKNLQINMARLTFMDSSGIGVLIGRYKEITQRGGIVSVTGQNPQIDKILKMAGLYKIIKQC